MKVAAAALALLFVGQPDVATVTVDLHGRPQLVRLYGKPGGPAAVVSSGDGGWIHLAPHIAQLLASRGWFVVGVDSRAYLSSATRSAPLSVDDVPRDYASLLRLVGASPAPPIFVGVSEGAGLSVAAAADPALKRRVAGVVAVGLGDNNELAWHVRDAIIYLTKGTPKEPSFRATDVVGGVAPVPFVMIRPTLDEFVPRPESDRVFANALQPKALWTVPATDHRFSNNLDGFDAQLIASLRWIDSAARR